SKALFLTSTASGHERMGVIRGLVPSTAARRCAAMMPGSAFRNVFDGSLAASDVFPTPGRPYTSQPMDSLNSCNGTSRALPRGMLRASRSGRSRVNGTEGSTGHGPVLAAGLLARYSAALRDAPNGLFDDREVRLARAVARTVETGAEICSTRTRDLRRHHPRAVRAVADTA